MDLNISGHKCMFGSDGSQPLQPQSMAGKSSSSGRTRWVPVQQPQPALHAALTAQPVVTQGGEEEAQPSEAGAADSGYITQPLAGLAEAAPAS